MGRSTVAALALGLLAALILAVLSAPALAQTGGGLPAESGGAGLSALDKSFLLKAAQDGIAAIQAAQMAKQRASSDPVRQFAQHEVDDHTQDDESLVKLAGAAGLTPPAEPSPEQQRLFSLLEAVGPARFDRAYLRGTVRDHLAMLRLFQQEAQRGANFALRDFASATVPEIKNQLAAAQALLLVGGR